LFVLSSHGNDICDPFVDVVLDVGVVQVEANCDPRFTAAWDGSKPDDVQYIYQTLLCSPPHDIMSRSGLQRRPTATHSGHQSQWLAMQSLL